MAIFYPIPAAVVPRPNAAVLPLPTFDLGVLQGQSRMSAAALQAAAIPQVISRTTPAATPGATGTPYPMARNLGVESILETPPDSRLPQRVIQSAALFPPIVFFLPNPASARVAQIAEEARQLSVTPIPVRPRQTAVSIGTSPSLILIAPGSPQGDGAAALMAPWLIPVTPAKRPPSPPPPVPPTPPFGVAIMDPSISLGLWLGL